MKFRFSGDPLTPIEGRQHHYKMFSVEVEADDYETAYKIACTLFPPDGKPWSGYSLEPLVLDENDQQLSSNIIGIKRDVRKELVRLDVCE